MAVRVYSGWRGLCKGRRGPGAQAVTGAVELTAGGVAEAGPVVWRSGLCVPSMGTVLMGLKSPV